MKNIAVKDDRVYTPEDYFSLPDDGNRYELVDGTLYAMSAPDGFHQDIVGHIFRKISDYLEGKPCRAYTSPFDVKLDSKIFQPDLFVLCNKDKLFKTDYQYVEGAPDFIIEVWSESTGRYDLMGKRRHYEEAGVREYWIIRSVRQVYAYRLNEQGIYEETVYTSVKDIDVPSAIFPGLTIRLGPFIHDWA